MERSSLQLISLDCKREEFSKVNNSYNIKPKLQTSELFVFVIEDVTSGGGACELVFNCAVF